MARRISNTRPTPRQKAGRRDSAELRQVMNVIQSRAAMMAGAWKDARDIDNKLGYPQAYSLQPKDYKEFYDWHGIAARVVEVYPEACWELDPRITDSETSKTTPWEDEITQLDKNHGVYSMLHRLDVASRIGHFGVMLIGVDDGLDLEEPIDGVDDETSDGSGSIGEILFLRVFDQSQVDIVDFETDKSSPRYGRPNYYNITMNNSTESNGVTSEPSNITKVHWSRIIHVADNKLSSEVFGAPAMRPVYHRLWDLRKILGGSGEMFWRGGFPGIAFEVSPDVVGMPDFDEDAKNSLKEQMYNYSNGMDRYFAAVGLKANQLSPNVTDPDNHYMVQIKAIALTLSVPYRIFMGSEEAKLASETDREAWYARVARRQDKHCAPSIIRPFFDRLISYGVLEKPAKDYIAGWEEEEKITEDDAAIAKLLVEAMAKYVQAGLDVIITPEDFLVHVLGFGKEKAENIIKAAEKLAEETEAEDLAMMKEMGMPAIPGQDPMMPGMPAVPGMPPGAPLQPPGGRPKKPGAKPPFAKKAPKKPVAAP